MVLTTDHRRVAAGHADRRPVRELPQPVLATRKASLNQNLATTRMQTERIRRTLCHRERSVFTTVTTSDTDHPHKTASSNVSSELEAVIPSRLNGAPLPVSHRAIKIQAVQYQTGQNAISFIQKLNQIIGKISKMLGIMIEGRTIQAHRTGITIAIAMNRQTNRE